MVGEQDTHKLTEVASARRTAYIALRTIHQLCFRGEPPLSDASSIFARLMAVIEDRKRNPSEKSYTTRLLAGGAAKIGEKIREEAAEVAQAAGEPDAAGRSHLIHEAADLVYHLLVMLGHRDIRIEELEAELSRRFGVSGLEEKAARPPAAAKTDKPPEQTT